MKLTRCRRPGPALAVLALAGGVISAYAETSPYYIGITQRFTHQSNVLQTSSGGSSDTVSSTSLVAGLDQPIGRQRLFGNLTASTNHYSNNSALNHPTYSARLGLDWSTVERISGSLTADTSQSLGEFTPAGLPGTSSKYTSRSQGIAAVARVGVVTRLTGEATLSHRSNRNSDIAFAARESDVNEGSVGLKYRPGGYLGLGAALRMTRTSYPRYLEPTPGQFVSEGAEAKNLDLTADWTISGASSLNARVSLGRNTYDTASLRDFSGVTGSIGWAWKPTGKVSVNVGLTRNAGDDTTPVVGTDQVVTATSISRVANTLSIGAGYELTSKVALRANASVTDSTVVDPLAASSGTVRTDAVGLGISWAATRSITTGCDYSRSTRGAAGALASAYVSDSFGCYGSITLR